MAIALRLTCFGQSFDERKTGWCGGDQESVRNLAAAETDIESLRPDFVVVEHEECGGNV